MTVSIEAIRREFDQDGIEFPDVLLSDKYRPYLNKAFTRKVDPAKYVEWIDSHRDVDYKPIVQDALDYAQLLKEPNKRKDKRTKKARAPKPEKVKREYPDTNYLVLLLPTPEQAKQLEAMGNAVRIAWNSALKFTKVRL
jgi:hypothetical protein